jgi:ATP-binding cassette subfamily B (MDR/TAP) protein 1
LNGEIHEVDIYSKSLTYAKKVAINYGLLLGASFGLIYFVMNADYALGFYYGSKLIEDREWNDLNVFILYTLQLSWFIV